MRRNLPETKVKYIWVGYDQSGGFQIQRTLLKFAITNIPPGSIVKSAKLSLFLARATENSSAMNVQVVRVTSDQNNDSWLNSTSEEMTWQRHLQLQTTDANSASTSVSTNLGRYEWQITNLVTDWVNSNPRSSYLTLMLKGDESIGQHERGFWTKDCNLQECGIDKLPLITIEFETPTPTPTQSPTVTPTPTLIPTAIPTPTPGVETLRLTTNKPGEIAINEKLTYRLDYKTNNFDDYVLTNVVISDVVPAHTELLTDTITSSGDFIPTYTGSTAGSVITWRSSSSLLPNQSGNVIYTVKRTTATTTTLVTFDEERALTEDDVIYNDGMEMSWLYDGKRESIRSNVARNPPHYIYLPILSR